MRRAEKRQHRNALDEFGFFPRTRYWRPTEAWERAWRRNLAHAPRKHTAKESLAIKHAVWDWREQDPSTRTTETQLAASLDVSKQYVSHLAHALPPRVALPPVRLPPVRHNSIRHSPGAFRSTSIGYAEPAIEGHSWDCQCLACCATRRIQNALGQ